MSRLQPVIGTEIVNDIRLGHTWEEYNVLRDFILEQKPKWFVEVGIHEGGLPYLLLPLLKEDDIKYFGIELDCRIIRPEVHTLIQNHKAALVCDNCFSDAVSDAVNMLPNKIIYCDGGNKVEELKHFKQFCVPGDIIMAHDFWDGDRRIKGVDEPHPEVLPMDVVHLDVSDTFVRLNETIFKETRIIGWKKL